MRAVLDTDVLVSAMLTPHGRCGQVLDLALDGSIDVCVEDRILLEYDAVVDHTRFDLDPEAVQEVLGFMHLVAEPIGARPLPIHLPHEDDRPFLEVAASADAILVTGNKRHFPKRSRKGVAVLDCAEFLELLRQYT